MDGWKRILLTEDKKAKGREVSFQLRGGVKVRECLASLAPQRDHSAQNHSITQPFSPQLPAQQVPYQMLCRRLETRLGSRHFFTHPYLLLKPEGRMSLPAGFDKTNSLSLGRRNEVLLFRCFSMESCCKTQERLKVKAQFSPPLQPFSIFKMEKQLKSLGFSWDRCPRPELALC